METKNDFSWSTLPRSNVRFQMLQNEEEKNEIRTNNNRMSVTLRKLEKNRNLDRRRKIIDLRESVSYNRNVV